MIRLIRALLFASLAGAATACSSSEVRSVGLGGTVSLADLGQGRDSKLATVEVAGVVLGAGPAIVHGGSRFFCYDPVDIHFDADGETSYEELSYGAREGLRLEGIPVDSSQPGGKDSAAFLLRGTVSFDLTWCQFSFGVVEVEGTQSTYWELYSLLDQKPVYSVTVTTSVALREVQSADSLIIRALELSVQQSARNLARANSFRQVLAAATEHATAPSPGAEPIVIARLPWATGSFQANSAQIQAATVVLERKGHGSGFFITRDGYILTNAHVVGGAKQIRVVLHGGEVVTGRVVRVDTRRDVALVKVEVASPGALPLHRTLPAVGADVYAVGAPLERYLTGTVTKGIVSAIRSEPDGTRYIQADVDIQPGSSGGPLTDDKGNVLGLAVLGIQARESGSIGLNFFIPIEDALAALKVSVQ